MRSRDVLVYRSLILLALLSLNFFNSVLARGGDEPDVPDLKFTPLQLLSIVELNLRGKSDPKKSDVDRLEECERITGLTTEITSSLSFDRRLFDLLQEAPISSTLMEYVETKSGQAPDFFKRRQYLFEWYATLYQLIAACEIAKYSEPALGKSMLKRVERMEREILKLKKSPENKNLAERVSEIADAVDPSEKNLSQAVEATDRLFSFLEPGAPTPRPPPREELRIPGAETLGNAYRATAKVLRSPTFWKVVGVTALVGGAAVGIVYLARSGGGGNSTTYALSERGCTGDPFCQVCKNCNYCAHCKNPYYSRPCGVYFRVRGLSP